MTMNLIHCMPFGPPRVGKTCIKDRLAGKTPKGEPARRDESGRIICPCEQSLSTGAAEPVLKIMVEVEHSVSTTYHEGEERWVQYDFNEEVIYVVKNFKVQSAGFDQVHNIVEDKVDQETVPKFTTELERSVELKGVSVQTKALDDSKDIVTPTVELEENIESMASQQKKQSIVTEHKSAGSEMKDVAKQEETKSSSPLREVVNSDPLQPVRDVFHFIEDPSLVKALVAQKFRIHFTDTGGQPEFQEIIPMLVSGPSLFFLVFSLATGLKGKYEVEYRDACEKLAEPYKSSFTVKEVMLQCLSSITCISTERKKSGKVKIMRPKVMFIGTHRDLIEKDQFEQINEELGIAIDQPGFADIVETPSNDQFLFAVDNFDYESNDFNEIQRAVSDMAHREEDMYCLDLLVPFVLLDFYLRQPADRLPKELSHCTGPVMRMEDFKLLAKKCGISATEIQEAIWTLHHVLGTIRHYPEVDELKDIVITRMQVFFNIPTRIIISTFSLRLNRKKISSQPCKDFRRKGFFTLSDLDKIWEEEKNYLSSKQLVALLMHLHILVPISHKDSDGKKVSGYFLPCVLQHAPPQQCSDDHTLIAEPLLVKFKCGFLMKGVFSGLLAFFLLHQPGENELSFELCQSKLFRDQASLCLCVKKRTSIYLTLKAMPEWIRFSLHYCQRVCDSSYLYTSVKKLIEKGLETVVSRLNYSVNTTAMFGYECKCAIQKPRFIEYMESSNWFSKSTCCDIPHHYTKWFEGEVFKLWVFYHYTHACIPFVFTLAHAACIDHVKKATFLCIISKLSTRRLC